MMFCFLSLAVLQQMHANNFLSTGDIQMKNVPMGVGGRGRAVAARAKAKAGAAPGRGRG